MSIGWGAYVSTGVRLFVCCIFVLCLCVVFASRVYAGIALGNWSVKEDISLGLFDILTWVELACLPLVKV